MPRIAGLELLAFSANHHNPSRSWLLVKLLTDQPGLYGLGDASAMDAVAGGFPRPIGQLDVASYGPGLGLELDEAEIARHPP